jgi:integrase/recombinase XerD
MTKLEVYREYLINIKRSLVYYNYLRVLFPYLENKHLDYLGLTKEQLAEYFTVKNYSSNAINNVIKSCRDFCRFDNIEKHACFEIKLLEVENRLRTYITYEELLKGIKYYATYNVRGMSTDKCSAILKFWFFTSIRKGELLSLTRSKIDLVSCSASIWGQKDKTERIVYFPDNFANELTEYFSSEEEKNNAFSITIGEINYLVKKIGKYLDKNISPHTFRHSGAKYMVSKNVSPLIMQRIMGHNSLQTTLIYAQIDDKQAQEVYKKQIG